MLDDIEASEASLGQRNWLNNSCCRVVSAVLIEADQHSTASWQCHSSLQPFAPTQVNGRVAVPGLS